MKKLMFCLVGAIAVSAFAQAKAVKKVLTPEEREANRQKFMEAFMRSAGGFVNRPGTQKGEVVYVNCQKRAAQALIDESVKYFATVTKFKIGSKSGSFDFRNPKIEGSATLFVVDDAALPPLLVAPESRWALVNVAPIAVETRPAYFEARVKKELTRGFAYLCGAANSQYPRALTRGIVNQAELDQNFDAALPVDVIQRFKTYMEPLGVTPAEKVSYKQAVMEGWAAQPTNEYQKAIWDKIHALPTAPIKIQPEKR